MRLISKWWGFLAQMFHTFHTSHKRYGSLQSNNHAALPYLPYVPYHFHIHTRAHAHTHTRARTHIFIISSMEGMEGMETPISMRLPAFHTCSTPSTRYGSMNQHTEFEIEQPASKPDADTLRAAFPECAEAVDAWRAVFGNLTVEATRENGQTVKTKNYKAESEYRTVITGEDYMRMGKLSEQSHQFAEMSAKYAKRK